MPSVHPFFRRILQNMVRLVPTVTKEFHLEKCFLRNISQVHLDEIQTQDEMVFSALTFSRLALLPKCYSNPYHFS